MTNTTDTPAELLPCPFCGSDDVESYLGRGSAFIRCDDGCGAEGPHCDSEPCAIERWNTRARSEPTQAASLDEEKGRP
jgi:Lar family restriction alleviation protein